MDAQTVRLAMSEAGRKGANARWANATDADKTAAARHASRARWNGHRKLKPKKRRKADQ